MGIIDFKGVEAAKPSLGGNYIKGPSDLLCRLDKVKEIETRKSGPAICIEMTVFHVFEGNHVVAENVTHMLMQNQDSFLGNWKAFVMGTQGCAEDEVTQEMSEIICGDTQPLSGDVIRVKAREIKTKADKEFTLVSYHGEVLAEEWKPLLGEESLAKLGIEA